MAKNVLEFEPHLALFVPDEDPLLFYRLLAENAKKQLVNNGCLYLEIHEDYAVEMKALLSDFGFAEIEIRNDLQGKSRMLKAVNKTV
jgi:release factor glutamine methyltransferase